MKRVHAGSEVATRGWAEASTTLTSLADWDVLLLPGQVYHEVAANTAEYYDIPLATLDDIPLRVKGQLVLGLPSPLIRSAVTAVWWAHWCMAKQADDAQRTELGRKVGATQRFSSTTRESLVANLPAILARTTAPEPGRWPPR